MTLDEKIEEIEKAIERLENSGDDHSEGMLAAMAEALREERQTLKWLKDYKRLLEEALEKQNTGNWIEYKTDKLNFICSKCHFFSNKNYKYCPDCGAKMKGE